MKKDERTFGLDNLFYEEAPKEKMLPNGLFSRMIRQILVFLRHSKRSKYTDQLEILRRKQPLTNDRDAQRLKRLISNSNLEKQFNMGVMTAEFIIYWILKPLVITYFGLHYYWNKFKKSSSEKCEVKQLRKLKKSYKHKADERAKRQSKTIYLRNP